MGKTKLELIKKYEAEKQRLEPLAYREGNTDRHEGELFQVEKILRDLKSLNEAIVPKPIPNVFCGGCGRSVEECIADARKGAQGL